MQYFAFSALLSFALVLVAGLAGWGSPLVLAHGVFALGIVPLIFAAMGHFVPVLTRSGSPHRAIAALPGLAQGAGMLAVMSLGGDLPRWCLHLAASLDLLSALALLLWMAGRARRCLGPAHPGWRWYGAALGALMLALAAVLLLDYWPGAYAALRRFHLHLNTLGFVGLAALGTLPVLLPTALKQPNPLAAPWLRHWLWPVASGVLLIALGAAVMPWMAQLGALALLAALLVLLAQWWRHYGKRLLAPGASPSLVVALLGYILTTVFGMAHGYWIPAHPAAIVAWGLAFLLPLVSGALTHLLPVWRYPGPVTPRRERLAEGLCLGSRLRSLCFLSGGFGAWMGGLPWAAVLSAAGLGLFGLALARGLLQAGGSGTRD